MSKKVYCYVRFSSKKQQLGDSIERQEKLIEKYLTEHGATVAEQFSDLGVSAFRGKNVKVGALSRFLDRVKTGEISFGDTLIVESLDRISRQKELNTLEIIIAILNAGVVIYTLSDGRIYNAASEDQANLVFQINFIISRAYDESLTKQKRSVSAWKKKHEEARNSQKIMTKKLPYWLRAVEHEGEWRIEVVESRAKEIKLAFELAKYKLGAQAVASRLNKSGAEKRWTLIAVRHLLSSKAVYGTLEVFKTKSLSGDLAPGQVYEEIDNYYPAVIEKNEYYNVQSVLQKNKDTYSVRGRTPKGFRNVFKGLIKCIYCDSFMHQNFLRRKGKEYMYLVCHKSLVNACPAGKKVIVPYRHILEPFLFLFKNYGVERLFELSRNSQENNQRLVAIKQEIQEKKITIEKMLIDIENNQGEIPRSIMMLLSRLETKVFELEGDHNRLVAEIELDKNSAEIRDEVSRANLEKMLEDEDGRLRFNTLLSDGKIEILVDRKPDEEYSSLFIMFSAKGFSENIRFNRKEAIIPLRGTYNYAKKTFSSVIDPEIRQEVHEVDYTEFEIDWTL
ncbi:TPA: recombinase family protein [Pseudomonas putida]|nr:recombinase family protein [Pseudomonas putida]